MKKLLQLIFILLLSNFGLAQTTPNIGLNIPTFGAQNWNVQMNANFSALDFFLSGNTAIPALNIAGVLKLNGIMGSTQCLHVDAFGNVSGTGIDCGAGLGNFVNGVTANGGLLLTGTTVGLLTTCSTGQVENWNGTAWVCAYVTGTGTVTHSLGALLAGVGVIGNGGNDLQTDANFDDGITTANVFSIKSTGGLGLTKGPLTLSGSTSGSSVLSVMATGGTLNLGSTNATVSAAGAIVGTNVTSSALTSGNCVQASTGGILTTVAGACGIGSLNGVTANGGLLLTGTTVGMLTTCTTGQVEQWNGSAWACATGAGTGTVVHVVGLLTSGLGVIGNGGSDVETDANFDDGVTTANVFSINTTNGATLTKGPLTLNGSTSGATVLSATATGSTLNLGSTNATVSLAGAGLFTNLTSSALTPGNCVQASTAGILTTVAGACGISGSGVTGATANGGLLLTSTTLGLLTSCSSSQVLQWNGSAWVCATVTGTGTVTHSVGALTAGLFMIGNGAADSEVDPNFDDGVTTSGVFSVKTTAGEYLTKGPLTLFGSTSGSIALSATATLGTLNLGSNATVTAAGAVVATNLTSSALTSGNCVQASTGGVLTTVAGACGTTGVNGATTGGGLLLTGTTLGLLTTCSSSQVEQWNGSAWVCATITGTGTVTHTVGALTAGLGMIGNGGADSEVDANFDDGITTASTFSIKSTGGLALTKGGLTLQGSTSGSALLSVTSFGGTLNLGSTNATVTSTGALIAASLTGSALTPGSCVQASTGGILTTVVGACGSGSGSVTHTVGALTLGLGVVGNGSADIKTDANFDDGITVANTFSIKSTSGLKLSGPLSIAGAQLFASGGFAALPGTPGASLSAIVAGPLGNPYWSASNAAYQQILVRGGVVASDVTSETFATAQIPDIGGVYGYEYESNKGVVGGYPALIANGTVALGTSAIPSGTCAAAVTVSAPGVQTIDVVRAGQNGPISGITGYTPATTGMLRIDAYPTVNNVNFQVCNNTLASITPGAVTLNWQVVR